MRIVCPVCGKDLQCMCLAVNPPIYRYRCSCGWTCDERETVQRVVFRAPESKGAVTNFAQQTNGSERKGAQDNAEIAHTSHMAVWSVSMSDVVMTKWQCTGCGDGGDGPCTSFGVSAPHACPYGTEENMVWEGVFAPQNIEEAQTPSNTGSPKSAPEIVESANVCEYCQRRISGLCEPKYCDDSFSGFIGRKLRAGA